MIKWLAALLGYFLFRFPGAILGFLLGSLAENMGGSGSGAKTVFSSSGQQNVSPQDFELNLLSLCSIIIKADGKVNQTELDYVRQYFLSTYGKERANAIFRTFNEVIKKREISAQRICTYMVQRTRYEVVTVDVGLIEFLIPVTILITALFNFTYVFKEGVNLGELLHYVATAFFGLIHGFGFSNYFKMLMAEEEDKITPLLGFATGIELSQVTIILLVLAIAFIFLDLLKVKRNIFIAAASILIIAITIPLLIATFPK